MHPGCTFFKPGFALFSISPASFRQTTIDAFIFFLLLNFICSQCSRALKIETLLEFSRTDLGQIFVCFLDYIFTSCFARLMQTSHNVSFSTVVFGAFSKNWNAERNTGAPYFRNKSREKFRREEWAKVVWLMSVRFLNLNPTGRNTRVNICSLERNYSSWM